MPGKGTVYHISIHLADNEWGHELMEKVAKEWLADHPEFEPVEVEVWEHGGWFLTYNRQMAVVDTANDMAEMSDECVKFYELTTGFDYKFLGSIRRTAKEVTA